MPLLFSFCFSFFTIKLWLSFFLFAPLLVYFPPFRLDSLNWLKEARPSFRLVLCGFPRSEMCVLLLLFLLSRCLVHKHLQKGKNTFRFTTFCFTLQWTITLPLTLCSLSSWQQGACLRLTAINVNVSLQRLILQFNWRNTILAQGGHVTINIEYKQLKLQMHGFRRDLNRYKTL